MICTKRIYEDPEISDGYRILVDRLWPRGVSKQHAALDEWCKDVAPSPELRTWFGHKAERFEEFSARYLEELQSNPAVDHIKSLRKNHSTITLLYAAHDPNINHAIVLQKHLTKASQRD